MNEWIEVMNESHSNLKEFEKQLVCYLWPDLSVYLIQHLFPYHNSSIFILAPLFSPIPNSFF